YIYIYLLSNGVFNRLEPSIRRANQKQKPWLVLKGFAICSPPAGRAMEVEGDESQQHVVQARHIKKRALKNKALSVSFSEKDLSDFVTGFHKRKKKRRKEAQNQQQEALRRKPAPNPDAESNENDEVKEAEGKEEEVEEEEEHLTSVSGTQVYETGSVKVMVTTSEISREDDSLNGNLRAAEIPKLTPASEKKLNLPVIKKKPFKKVEKRRSRPKTQTKRDKRKGKNKNETRR
ncbi:Nucleolar protein 12, partial [Cynara cardunculus var. scolymus]